MATIGLIVGVLWIFGWAILILIFWYVRGVWRDRRLKMLHEERMKALEKGIPLAEFPELYNPSEGWLTRQFSSEVNPRWPLGVGTLLISTGLGLCLSFYLSGDEYLREIWSFGLIGVFVGFGFFLHYLITHRPGPSPEPSAAARVTPLLGVRWGFHPVASLFARASGFS